MSNTNLTISMITKEAMRLAHEKMTFVGTINRDYDDNYAKSGAKIGNALRVRQPNAFTRRQGSRVMSVQDVTELATTVTMATQDGVDMRFSSAELALDIDEFSKRYLQPAMSVLASGIDGDVIAGCSKLVYNQTGAAGTVVGATDLTAVHNARAKLNQFLAPLDRRVVQCDSTTMASIAAVNRLVVQPDKDVAKAWREGYYGRIAGADFYENERTYVHTVGADVTVSTSSSSAATDGGTTITMNGSDGSVKKGDIFTIPKVFACHPETKANTGRLMQFVCTADSTGAITVSPTTYWSGARQNVCNSTGGASVVADFDSEVMTFTGTAATAYRQNLMYHPDAFTFVTADLPLMAGAESCVRMNKDGISLRVWSDGDIRNDELLTRIDILYGYAVLRPEWACRMTN